jgi:hypothetical protein
MQHSAASARLRSLPFAAHFEIVLIVPTGFHDASLRVSGNSFENVCDLVNQYMGHQRGASLRVQFLHPIGEHDDSPLIGLRISHNFGFHSDRGLVRRPDADGIGPGWAGMPPLPIDFQPILANMAEANGRTLLGNAGPDPCRQSQWPVAPAPLSGTRLVPAIVNTAAKRLVVISCSTSTAAGGGSQENRPRS